MYEGINRFLLRYSNFGYMPKGIYFGPAAGLCPGFCLCVFVCGDVLPRLIPKNECGIVYGHIYSLLFSEKVPEYIIYICKIFLTCDKCFIGVPFV